MLLMVKLDELDKKIMELLRKDSRIPYTNMAKILDLSEGTVRRRIRNLVCSGAIKRFTIETLGERIKVLVLVSVDPSVPTSQVAEKISKLEGVMSLFEVTGSYDITFVVAGKDLVLINQIVEDVRSLKGVQQTNTLFVLKAW